jgi:hypothetical protein
MHSNQSSSTPSHRPHQHSQSHSQHLSHPHHHHHQQHRRYSTSSQSQFECLLNELDSMEHRIQVLHTSLMNNSTRVSDGLLPLQPPSPEISRARPSTYHLEHRIPPLPLRFPSSLDLERSDSRPRLRFNFHIRRQSFSNVEDEEDAWDLERYLDEDADYESASSDDDDRYSNDTSIPEDIQLALLSFERPATSNDISKCSSCPICLSDITLGTPLSSLPCRHTFHASCLYSWFGFCASKVTCPCCRSHIPTAIRQFISSPVCNPRASPTLVDS